ncbi:MAG: HAD hydrolase-like protein [Deltaproteobacteria bacterium]|nr:HAD hydrolase-like protein [Deltaproteobacteria bacterium]
MTAFGHLVFDLDGTLVDTKDDLAEAVNVTLRELGLPPEDPHTLWGYVGHGARALLERALGAEHTHLLEPGVAIFMPWYRAHLLDHSVLYPGLGAVVETLAEEGVLFSVLTNKPEDMSRAIVDGLGLGALFPRLVGGDTLAAKKPDPSGLLRLIGDTGVPAARTLMIGDSPIDVTTGRNAGVATCGVLWGFSGPSVRESAADVLIAAPDELLRVCRQGWRD